VPGIADNHVADAARALPACCVSWPAGRSGVVSANHSAENAFKVRLRGFQAASLLDHDRKETIMKTYALALAILGLTAAVPATAQTTQRPDTGSMAYPTPLPQGNIGTTVVGPQAPDTGNMAYPAPLPQGNVTGNSTTPRAADTGSMAYPAPVPQGNVGTTTVK